MPKIKIDHIVSFSSEDPIHIANNILSTDPAKKWKCKSPGEKTATIVLQLEKACVISSIDIGNEHSAYIEVLASRSGANDDFKVLLVMSSFMTPLESRQSTNVNKVRMFGIDQLSKPECEQKWDRIKVVCTQPFNRHVQYGLSFISLSTNEGVQVSNPVQTTIGKFTLRPESPDNLTSGSLFARRKELQETLKGAAAIREASALATTPLNKQKIKQALSTPSSSKRLSLDDTEKTPQPRNRNELLYSRDEEEPNEKIDRVIERKLTEKRVKDETKENGAPKNKENRKNRPALDISINSSSKDKEKKTFKDKPKESSKRKLNGDNTTSKKKMKKEQPTKPFSQLLNGVTLVISGIQNPDRGKLRSMSLEMGGKYKPDWDNSCTHLICAFINTPKFNQVKGKGKIITRKWLEDCYSQRKRLPWRRYALDRTDAGKEESEEEILEESGPAEAPSSSSQNIDNSPEQCDTGSDTEERIAKILFNQKKPKSPNCFGVDTDDEVEVIPNSKGDIGDKFKDFFRRKTFYIDQTFDKSIYNTLKKYITAYQGVITEDPTDTGEIITSEANSDTMKEINSEATIIRPDWIWECHNCQSLVPVDDYVL